MAFEYYNEYEDQKEGDESCPNCGISYDEIDYEYQICHICKYDNSGKPETCKPEPETDPNQLEIDFNPSRLTGA